MCIRDRPKSGRPWELAPSIELSVPDGGGWQTVASIHDNWQRRVVLSLTKPCSAGALRLTFETADRAPEHLAQVFEMCIRDSAESGRGLLHAAFALLSQSVIKIMGAFGKLSSA